MKLLARRGTAYLFDVSPMILSGFLYPPLLSKYIGFSLVIGFNLIYFLFYFPIMESWIGKTLGKDLTGLKVVTDGGESVGTLKAIGRHLARFIDLLPHPLVPLIGIITIIATTENKRLGDILAGTKVVEE